MSVLERRLACPGSALAEQGRPNTSSAAADRGTMLHDAAAKALISGVDADDVLDDDAEGAALVQVYLDEVRAVHARLGGVLLVEHQFHLSDLSEWLWGTADAVILAPPNLAVLDLKTGGHVVPIQRPNGTPNLQLAGYALGAMQAVPAGEVIDQVELVVVQPARGGAHRLVVDSMDLSDLAADIIDGVTAGTQPDAAREAGEHCLFCRAKVGCPALREAAYSGTRVAAADEFDVVTEVLELEQIDPPSPLDLTPDQLGRALQAADVMDIWVSAVRQHATDLADRGEPIPGYKLVQRRGVRSFRKESLDQVERLARNVGLQDEDILTPPKLRTPKQLEQAFKARKITPPSKNIWEGLVVTSNPGTALVPEADPRPALLRGARHEFEVEPDSFE